MAEYDSEAGGAAVDALMAAITGEPLPEDADAGLRAEHRAAQADVTTLREQLGIIGAALSEPEETGEPATVPRTARRRRPRRPAGGPGRGSRHPGVKSVALGVFVAAALGTSVVGLGWLIAQGGGAASDSSADGANEDSGSAAGSKSSTAPGPEYLACLRLVVEGKVVTVERLPDLGQDRITLDVTRYYRPTHGKDEVTFVVDEGLDTHPGKGDHVLVGVPRGTASADLWVKGEEDIARERARIVAELPKANRTDCTER